MRKILAVIVCSLVLMACFFTFALHRVFSHRDRNQSRRIQKYIDAELNTHRFFSNAKMDALVTLDDKTNFYVKTKPGALYIKFNKDENDYEAYTRIKRLGEGLKHKLTEN
jgi:hypothetical protein